MTQERSKILVAEDEGLVAEDVRRRLEGMGYEVVGTVQTGDQAIGMAGSMRPNLVLMDVMLRGPIDGIEAAEQIRKMYHIPIVFLSALADEHTLDRAKLAEPFGYLLKPFDERELYTTIEMALYKHRVDQRLQESEMRFRMLYEHAPLGYQSLNAEGRFVEVNEKWLNTLGYTRDEVLGRWFGDFMTPESAERVRFNFPRFVKAGEIHGAEFEMIRKDGSHLIADFNGIIGRDREGSFQRTHCIFTDVTAARQSEKLLKEKNALLSSMMQSPSSISIIATDLHGIIEYWNAGAETLFGYRAEEVLGREHASILYGHNQETAQAIRTIRETVIAKRGSVQCELQEVTRDGRKLWINLTASPRLDDAGNVLGILGIGEDITKRRRAEQTRNAAYAISEAAQSEPTLHGLFSSIHHAISDLVPAKNFYIALLDPVQNLLSFPYFVDEKEDAPPPSTPGRGLTEYILRLGQPLLVSPELYDSLVASGEVDPCGPPSVDWIGVPLNDGKTTHGVLVVQSYSPGIRFSEDDMQILAFVSAQAALAISRKRSEQALRESEAELRALLSAMSDVILMIDADGKYLKVAQGNAALLAGSPDNLVGKSFDDIFPPELAAQFHAHVREALATQSPIRTEYVLDINNREVWFEASISPALNNTVVWVARDVTARKLAERQLIEDERKYKELAELLPQTVFEADKNGKFSFVNDQAFLTFGYSEEEFRKGCTLFDMIAQSEHERARRNYGSVFQGQVRGHGEEYLARRKDGTTFPAVVYSSVMLSGGKSVGVRGILTDISDRKASEDALRESEERYRQLIDRSPDAIAVHKNGIIVFANPAGQALIGAKNPDELLGRRLLDFVHPDFHQLIADRAPLLQTSTQKMPLVEMRLVRLDGAMIDVDVTAIQIMFGGEHAVLVVLRDVTERKQKEREFRLLAQTVASTRDSMSIITPEGTILFVNDAFLSAYGYSEAELIGREASILFAQDNTSATVDTIREASLKGGWYGEVMHRRKDGTLFPVELWTSPVKSDVGQPVAFVGVARDITERKQVEKAIRESETRLRTITDNMIDMVSQLDLNAVWQYVSPSAKRVLGYDSAKLIGQKALSYVHRSDIRRVVSAFRSSNETAPMENVEYRFKTATGEYRWLESSIKALQDADGSVSGYVVGSRDVTERRKAEEQIRASLSEKEVLLKEVHHRVKNNLQIISSLLNLQIQGKDERYAETFRESQNRIRSMALIHEQLYRSQDLSRIDFSEYVHSLASSLQRSYASRAARLSLCIKVQDAYLPVNIAIPCGLIINELVSNSLKHAFPQGEKGDIAVHLKRAQGMMHIEVSDNGVGLPEGLDIRNAESLGLQLVDTLSKQINASVELQRNGGTTFIISFPLS